MTTQNTVTFEDDDTLTPARRDADLRLQPPCEYANNYLVAPDDHIQSERTDRVTHKDQYDYRQQNMQQ